MRDASLSDRGTLFADNNRSAGRNALAPGAQRSQYAARPRQKRAQWDAASTAHRISRGVTTTTQAPAEDRNPRISTRTDRVQRIAALRNAARRSIGPPTAAASASISAHPDVAAPGRRISQQVNSATAHCSAAAQRSQQRAPTTTECSAATQCPAKRQCPQQRSAPQKRSAPPQQRSAPQQRSPHSVVLHSKGGSAAAPVPATGSAPQQRSVATAAVLPQQRSAPSSAVLAANAVLRSTQCLRSNAVLREAVLAVSENYGVGVKSVLAFLHAFMETCSRARTARDRRAEQ